MCVCERERDFRLCVARDFSTDILSNRNQLWTGGGGSEVAQWIDISGLCFLAGILLQCSYRVIRHRFHPVLNKLIMLMENEKIV